MKYFSIALLFLVSFAGCEKDKAPTYGTAEQVKIDDDIIKNYLTENNKEATSHSSGIYYEIIVEGTGGHPNVNSTVEVKYKGYFTNHVVFDETTGSKTFVNALSELIVGWQIGIPLLQKGGKGVLYVPSYLAYGSRGQGSIPPNTVLIFDIELIDFR